MGEEKVQTPEDNKEGKEGLNCDAKGCVLCLRVCVRVCLYVWRRGGVGGGVTWIKQPVSFSHAPCQVFITLYNLHVKRHSHSPRQA